MAGRWWRTRPRDKFASQRPKHRRTHPFLPAAGRQKPKTKGRGPENRLAGRSVLQPRIHTSPRLRFSSTSLIYTTGLLTALVSPARVTLPCPLGGITSPPQCAP